MSTSRETSTPSASTPPEIRSARIAALAAIMAAVISATSGVVQYVTSHQQVSAETSRDVDTTKQEAYAKMLAAQNEMLLASDNYEAIMDAPYRLHETPQDRVDGPNTISHLNALNKAYENLTIAASNVELVGSTESAKLAGTSVDLYGKLYSVSNALKIGSIGVVDAVRVTWDEVSASVRWTQTALRQRSREDLNHEKPQPLQAPPSSLRNSF